MAVGCARVRGAPSPSPHRRRRPSRLAVVVAAAAATTAVAAAASPAAAGENYEGCSTVIVGAGIGGAYTAWRLAVDDGGRKAAGRSICVFEAAARPGGRILTFRDAPSPFDGSAVDLGAYRFHRGEHAMVRSVAEGRLGLVTHCYSDPLGDTLRGMAAGVNGTADHVTRRVAVCPPQTRPVTVARGVRFAAAPGAAFSRADPVRDGVEGVAYNPSLPWVIPPPGRWGPNAALRAPRSAFGLLMGPGSPIPEVAKNFLRLVRAPTYDAAMVVADDIVGKLRGAAYKGVKLHEVTVYQVAQAEGMSPEELALSQDTNVGIGVFSQMTVADFLADALRGIALGKGDFDGPRDYVTPVAADASGAGVRRIGMGSIVEGLLDAAKGAGVRVFYTTRLTGVRRAGTGVRLSFANGASVEARRAFLNMGKPDVAALGGTSLPTAGATRPFARAFGALKVVGLSKAYCWWSDAWWLSRLNATAGVVATGGALSSARYHDGSVRCADAAARTGCAGSMLVSYNVGDATGAESGGYLASHDGTGYYPGSATDAVRVLKAGALTARQRLLWGAIQEEVARVHGPVLAAAGGGASPPPPDVCATAAWVDVGVHIASAHNSGLDEKDDALEAFVAPVPGVRLHLVGEAYGQAHGWAEAALRSAERALYHGVGVGRPPWLDARAHTSLIVKFNRGG